MSLQFPKIGIIFECTERNRVGNQFNYKKIDPHHIFLFIKRFANHSFMKGR